MRRYRISISGLVQGVGFRPFVYRQAVKHHISGFVRNTLQGVTIEAQGTEPQVEFFLQALFKERPVQSRISKKLIEEIAIREDEKAFFICSSSGNDEAVAQIPKDRSPCVTCIGELSDHSNRRYHYPFITCNDCGPRFTITQNLPFDRQNTTLRFFTLCALCQKEYCDPTNRRFHTQTLSCPTCGPKLTFKGYFGKQGENTHTQGAQALDQACALIQRGGLLALKGVGGYQLLCQAKAPASIARIRHFKGRSLKPLAVMAPSLAAAMQLCHISASEREQLCSPVAPIVLLYTKQGAPLLHTIDSTVAPGLPLLGVLLAASPLHHLLMETIKGWLVVTSANHRGEPIYICDDEAEQELETCVDGILFHDRIIAHQADDSVVRLADKQLIVLRHARGLAPTVIPFRQSKLADFANGIGMGGHSKAAFALGVKGSFILSPHLCDLDSPRSFRAFRREVASFASLYGMNLAASKIFHDVHPDYGSTRLAHEYTGEHIGVYHHEAHLEALLAESHFRGRALGVACDGSGYGRDQSLWGGEFFIIDGAQRTRVASLLPFSLPGGEAAIKEPRRAAFGLLYEAYGKNCLDHPFILSAFTPREQNLILLALRQSINTPRTTSLGRLFDGLAALLGLCSVSTYEAQTALEFEALAHAARVEADAKSEEVFPVTWQQAPSGLWLWDWRYLLPLAKEATNTGEGCKFAAAFHLNVVQAIHELALRFKMSTVLLSGGVFQNAILLRLCREQLTGAGITLLTHQRLPPGDGGLALGQIATGLRRNTYVSGNSR